MDGMRNGGMEDRRKKKEESSDDLFAFVFLLRGYFRQERKDFVGRWKESG